MHHDLHIKPKVHHITVLHDIVFSFDGKFSSFFTACFRAILLIVGNFDHFSLDKAFFEICMNNTRGLWSFPPFFDRPGSHFCLSSRKVSNQGLVAHRQPESVYPSQILSDHIHLRTFLFLLVRQILQFEIRWLR